MRLPHVLVLTLALISVFAAACGAPTSASLPAAQLFPAAPDVLPGRLLFVKDGNVWLYTEGRARQVTEGGTWQQPQWSPDGAEIAYVYRGSHFSDIFVMSADGTNSRRLTRGQSSSLADNDWSFRPTWSPNGAQIAFVTDSNSYHPSLWIMNRDGSGKRPLLAVSAIHEATDSMSWSPDGKRVALTAFGLEVSQIVLVDAVRGLGQPLTDNPKGVLDPAWSPDGTTLAYAVRDTGRMEIRLRRLDATIEVPVSRGGLARAATWSPDGGRLAFLSSKGGTFEIYVVDIVDEGGRLAARNERQLTRDLNLDATSGISWSK